MKTLADVKRKMTLGSKWRCVRLFEGCLLYTSDAADEL